MNTILEQLSSQNKTFEEWIETSLGKKIVNRLKEHWLLLTRIATFETKEDAIQRAMFLLWQEWTDEKLVEAATTYQAKTADQAMRLITRHIMLISATVYTQRRRRKGKFDDVLSTDHAEDHDEEWKIYTQCGGINRPVEDEVIRREEATSDEPTERDLFKEDIQYGVERAIRELITKAKNNKKSGEELDRLLRLIVEGYMYHHVPGNGANKWQNSFGEFISSHGYNPRHISYYSLKARTALRNHLVPFQLDYIAAYKKQG